MTTLYLVRHGETIDNVNHIMQGQTQGELTAAGVEQARKVAADMAEVAIDAFVSSDLKRAVDTCKIIAEPHCQEVKTTPLLRERDWGGFTGRYIPDLKDAVWPDDIETVEAMKERAARFIEYRKESNTTQTELAEKIGVNQTMISKIESGKYNPTFKQIYKISRRLTNSNEMFKNILKEILKNLEEIKEFN